MGGIGVEGGNHREVITATVGTKSYFGIESEYGGCDDEVDGGKFTGGWVYPGA